MAGSGWSQSIIYRRECSWLCNSWTVIIDQWNCRSRLSADRSHLAHRPNPLFFHIVYLPRHCVRTSQHFRIAHTLPSPARRRQPRRHSHRCFYPSLRVADAMWHDFWSPSLAIRLPTSRHEDQLTYTGLAIGSYVGGRKSATLLRGEIEVSISLLQIGYFWRDVFQWQNSE